MTDEAEDLRKEITRLKAENEELRGINAGQAQRLSLIAWWCGAPKNKISDFLAEINAE